MDFDITCREFGVSCSIRPLVNLSYDSDDILTLHGFRLPMHLRIGFLIDHDLGEAVPVSQIDEGQDTEIPLLGSPTHKDNGFSDIFGTQLST